MKTFVCVLLVAIAFGASLRGFNAIRQKPVLNFNQVFVQIKAMIAAKGPYSDVYNLLGDIKSQLLAEQAAQTAIYVDQMADCNDELTMRQGEMDEAAGAMIAANNQRTSCEGALSEASVTEGTLDATLTLKNQALAAERALRQSQYQVFLVFEEDLVEQIRNIRLAVTYAQELDTTVSTEAMNTMFFPQLSAKLAINAISTGTFSKMTPIFFAMSALIMDGEETDAPVNGTNETAPVVVDAPVDYGVVGAEDDAVTELIRLLNELLAETIQQLEDLRLEEGTRASEFVVNEAALVTVIGMIESELVEVRAHMVVMATCVSVETSVWDQANSKWGRNNGIWGATQTMCNTFEREYTDANDARNTELALLEALDQLVKEELSGGMRDSALTRGDQEQSDWVDHESETVYAYDGATFNYDSEGVYEDQTLDM